MRLSYQSHEYLLFEPLKSSDRLLLFITDVPKNDRLGILENLCTIGSLKSTEQHIIEKYEASMVTS